MKRTIPATIASEAVLVYDIEDDDDDDNNDDERWEKQLAAMVLGPPTMGTRKTRVSVGC